MDQLRRRVRSLVVIIGILGGLVGSAGSGLAQTQSCQFNISAPGTTTTTITINVQGVHCLITDVAMAASFTSGNAIEIATNNVILDLNGHEVGGQAAGPGTTAVGIHALQRKNLTIKNGTVRGFSAGIFLADAGLPFTTSQGHRVEGVRAEGNTSVGIWVDGQGNVVRGNQVVDTGGGAVVATTFGLVARGPGARILDNDVIERASSGGALAFGITVSNAPSSVVEGNRVGNQASPAAGSEGIRVVNTSTNVLVVGNRVLGWATGVFVESGSSGRCRDNFFAADVSPFLDGCTGVANNN